MEAIGLFGILSYFSFEDIKSRQLKTVALLLSGVLGLALHMMLRRISIEEIVGGMAIGAALYVLSILSGGKIGKGDAILVMITGIYLGFWHNLLMLWAAVMIAGMAGMTAVIVFKKGRDYELPFVPFILAAYCICLFFWGGSIG